MCEKSDVVNCDRIKEKRPYCRFGQNLFFSRIAKRIMETSNT